ncbi:aldehyde dehydrogenase family protein [Pseudofrankia sp. BMG5.36]|uniref:aldehyde dehydrogenase family protein n=1 Tax=Pseudofrankia sp. BMG5.36 TaxID=1834512 RepID=UPI0008D9C467|nr:aldehyde dehydrogenase family protein [Pseudofrankia sp. BMG5.36]OHV60587.1 aldehyde dehydrogenase [Pseudofrankia sp. BMG5.36]
MSTPVITPSGLFVEERLLIGGQLRPATGGRTYENVNPATEEVIGVAADATAEDMRDAIAAARAAFDEGTWASDVELRVRCLRQLHAALLRHAPELRETIRAEVGATNVSLDVPLFARALDNLTYAADLAEGYEFVRDLGVGESMGRMSRRRQYREPVGVVAAITPWNAPMQVNLAKVAFALAAGCTVILKPAPDTPWNATALGRLAVEETDLPPGVLNVVPTSDNAVAQLLAEDPRVDLISFTGSTAVGRHLMATAASTVKKVFLELGGKSAWIQCDDADVDTNALMVAYQSLAQSGQGCSINTRLLVQRSRYEEMVTKVADAFRSIPYGDPADPNTYMGPLINARQRQRVLDYIEIGKAEGARLVLGGGRPAHLERGYYVEPTIFADVDPNSRIAQEEIFGPVLVVIPFDTDEEAVRIANSTIFGLAGTVESADAARARAIAEKIRSGVVNVNGGMYFSCEVPFGGYKQSGVGREMGTLGFEEYTEVKIISEGVA